MENEIGIELEQPKKTAKDDTEMSSKYNPKSVEDQIYKLWEKSGAFQPVSDKQPTTKSQRPFTIVIPPPNVTGSLHMGHALNNTIQDILIRRSRMKGVPTLWVPGTDHAGIATQNVVEKQLAKEGKTRHDLGRKEFEKLVWEWVEKYGYIIIDQLKKLGCSCDWSRQRFTMDKGYSEAVKTAFLHYQKKGWIYQGERVINWCVRCQTALSDIEVEYKEQPAKLYFFKYDKNFPITIATTRPETKLGDTGVAVNPNDNRYKEYLGKTYEVNFAGLKRKIKIIADPQVNQKFGTGAVGVTPAHSLADAEMAEKNDLPKIKIIDQYGKMTAGAGKEYEGLKTTEAREKVLEWLKKENLLEKEEEITNNLSVCYRCGRELEPQPSKQWFLKMGELVKPAIEAVEKGEIKFVPERWKKVYLDWMKNIRDWCISRQIWFGHRLPVYQQEAISNSQLSISKQIPNPNNQKINENCDNENLMKIENCNLKIYVGSNPPAGYIQSPDVLDTWFSSALWPFATLGWPPSAKATGGKPTDLEYFYPTTILSTARDIIFLWVPRMVFSGYEFMGKKPFETVYIHPTIFNIEGKRMSKSLGTGVDPLDLIDKYGADAVRFGLAYINTGVQDIKFDEKAILAGQKFANKIWNIARFVMMQCESVIASEAKQSDRSPRPDRARDDISRPKTEADKKILSDLTNLIDLINLNLDNFRFGQAAHNLYDFIWHDFADQYIEQAKTQMENRMPRAAGEYRINTTEILIFVLRASLLLLHPFMPFITEEIWQELYSKKLVDEKMIIKAKWPVIEND